jgi:hypothetical protein
VFSFGFLQVLSRIPLVVFRGPSGLSPTKTLLGEEFTAAINGRYLKKYYPSIEVDH